MDFGNLLQRSWNIVWNNKFMFVLGFLAAIGSGGNFGSNTNFSFNRRGAQFTPQFADDLSRFFSRFGALLLGLLCIAFVILILFWLLRLVAQGAMISSAARADAGEKVSFGLVFSEGISNLGRLAGINLLMYGPFTLLGLLSVALFLATIGPVFLSELLEQSDSAGVLIAGLGTFAICMACLACLVVPLIIVVTGVYPFAQRGAVLQKLGVVDSIRHGWEILKRNLANILLLGILFLILGLLFGVILTVALIPFALLALLPAIVDLVTHDTVGAADVLLIVGGTILLGLVGAVVNSVMVAFRSTVVTLAYNEFIQEG
jgi:hypothetical protein